MVNSAQTFAFVVENHPSVILWQSHLFALHVDVLPYLSPSIYSVHTVIVVMVTVLTVIVAIFSIPHLHCQD